MGEALEDAGNLMLVVVAIAKGAGAPGSCDAAARGLVGQIPANLGHEFVEGGEENGLLVLYEASEMPRRALSEQEPAAAGDLEALVGELILIGVGEEAQVDFGSPDGLAVVLAV